MSGLFTAHTESVVRLFEAAMVTFLVQFDGTVTKISEHSYQTVAECEAHVHQKEFTSFVSEKGMEVYVCEWR